MPPPPAPDALFHAVSAGGGPTALSVVPPTEVTYGCEAGSWTFRKLAGATAVLGASGTPFTVRTIILPMLVLPPVATHVPAEVEEVEDVQAMASREMVPDT